MQNAQEIYDRIQDTKKEIKENKDILIEQYKQTPGYNEVQEELKALRAKRKHITNAVDAQNPEVVIKLEDLKIDLASDKELLNDIILSKYMRGEHVELEDKTKYNQAMLPLFTVTMRKAD